MASTSIESKSSFAADSLAVGMLVILAMTIVQRALGFLRGVWFCRLMDDSVVGQWAMAFDFINMVTPIMLFGIPGSLPRYVEAFRQSGHARAFVSRVLIVTLACTVGFFCLMLLLPDWFGWLVFLDVENRQLTHSVALGVLAIVAFNFVHQLVASLRQVRVASLMQFTQSVAFTVMGIYWLLSGGGLSGLILSFALASLIAVLPGGWTLVKGWKGLPKSESRFDASSMWRRLLPYAAALWSMNLLNNLFEMSDRYMILHLSSDSELVGQAAVGQYHSGRIFPLLLLSLASMVSGVLLPYLAADWESGRREAVIQRLRQVLAATSILFTLGSAMVLLLAPWLFSSLLQGRYTDGLALMPTAFVFYIWASLVTIGQDYLWVTEKGKLVGLALGAGLIVNIALNSLLMPIWGLQGAVTATLCSHAIVLVGVFIAMFKCGFRIDGMILLVVLLPVTLMVNPYVALCFVVFLLIASSQLKGWINDAFELAAFRIKRPIRSTAS